MTSWPWPQRLNSWDDDGLPDWRGLEVLVLGLGQSGLSMARWCTARGAQVTVADTRESPPHRNALQADCPGATLVCGPFEAGLMARAPWACVLRSPGLSPATLASVHAWVQAQGVPFLGELDLFAQALQGLAGRGRWPYRPQVVAVTGTNGKTTVTSLTARLLARAGERVAVAGNIGPALLDVLGAALRDEAHALAAEAEAMGAAQAVRETSGTEPSPDEVCPVDAPRNVGDGAEPPPYLPTVWVLELSSFQLDGTAGGPWDAVPTAATVLNLTEDHLDWHGSMAAYAQAKAAVFGAGARMVLNREDPQVMAWQPAEARFKLAGRWRSGPARPFETFGTDRPHRPGDWGIATFNGMDWLVRAPEEVEPASEPALPQRLMPVEALRIRGRHNAANALAALALAHATGVALAPMLHGLREYRGEPHRVEPVALIGGVEYFDDSKGTNVGATLAAVRGLGVERRLVVILGGDGKGQDFTPLVEPLARHARSVLLIGRDAPVLHRTLAAALETAHVRLETAADLPQAVRTAAERAQPGDAVLLSPACASLDMFDNYVHRAQVFVETVRALAAEAGVDLGGMA